MRRTLAVVGIALAIGVAVTLLAFLVAALLTVGSSFGLAGVIVLIVVMGSAVAVGFGAMITAVGFGLRRRARARPFTLLFAATLLAVPVTLNAAGGLLDGIGFRPFGDDVVAAAVGFVVVLWAVPATFVGVIRWRWLALILAGCALLSVLSVVL